MNRGISTSQESWWRTEQRGKGALQGRQLLGGAHQGSLDAGTGAPATSPAMALLEQRCSNSNSIFQAALEMELLA